jgi:hypothetical protein
MDQPISWFGGSRFTGFSDDEIRAILDGAALRLRKEMSVSRQEPWRARTPRAKRSVRRKAA